MHFRSHQSVDQRKLIKLENEGQILTTLADCVFNDLMDRPFKERLNAANDLIQMNQRAFGDMFTFFKASNLDDYPYQSILRVYSDTCNVAGPKCHVVLKSRFSEGDFVASGDTCQ